MNTAALRRKLKRAFGGTEQERRVVARQARDLADSERIDRDRGHALAPDDVVANLRDAPEGSDLVERWNWWLGALETAHGGYAEFEVRRVPETDDERLEDG